MTMAGHATFAASTSLAMLFLARGLAGTGAANIATAQAVLADTHAPDERSRAMALIGAAFGLGFIFGPAMGGVLFQLDQRAPAAFGSVLAAVNFLFVLFFLPETRSSSQTSLHARTKLSDLLSAGAQLRPLVFTTLLCITAFALMEQSVGLFIEYHWVSPDSPTAMQQATKLTSLFLVVVGVAATLVQGIFVRKWLKTKSEITLFRLGLATIGLSLLSIPLLGWIGSFTLFLVCGVSLALGSGMFNPSMAGLVSRASPEDKQGFGLAVNQSAASLGRIIGPTTAGLLFSISENAPFFVAAVLAALGVYISRNISLSRTPQNV
jgi:MFS family permease